MTKILVLGLLKKYGPMSGYDIQIGLEETRTELWMNVKPASIYYALKKLEEEKLIILDQVEQTGNRSRTTYKITEAGINLYEIKLLEKLSSFTVAFPGDLYGTVSFIHDIPANKAIKALQLQLTKIEKVIEEIKFGEGIKGKEEENTLISKTVFQNIYNICNLQKEYIEEIINIISDS